MDDMVTIEWPDNQPPSSDAEFWKQYLTEDETAPAVKEIIMPKQFKAIKLNVLVEGAKGGGGSGNFGHRGRPGHLGGSVGGTGAGGGSISEANAANDITASEILKFMGPDDTMGDARAVVNDLAAAGLHGNITKGQIKAAIAAREQRLIAKGLREPATSPISKAQSVAEDAAFKRTSTKFEQTMANQIAEEAAAARLKAKLDATQNFSGKPKPAANTITAKPSIKGNGTSTINRSDIKVGAVITGGNLDGYKIHTVTKFPNGSMRVVLMDEAGHIKGSLVPPKSTVAVIK